MFTLGAPQGIAMLIGVTLVDVVFFAHVCLVIGRKSAIKMFAVDIVGAFLFEEFVGLQSGLYYFTDLMGPRIDKAPLAIGLSWMAVVEFYAMGATMLMALVKWVDWVRLGVGSAIR